MPGKPYTKWDFMKKPKAATKATDAKWAAKKEALIRAAQKAGK